MISKVKRDVVRSIKLSAQEEEDLISMARQLNLPVQEVLRRGGLKEGKRLLHIQNRRRKILTAHQEKRCPTEVPIAPR